MAVANEFDGDEVELWNAFRKGDEEAFAQIARYYYRNLFSYGVKFSRDREFVKDCIQDLFLELWAKKESLGDTLFVNFYLLKSLRRKIYRENTRTGRILEETIPDWETDIATEDSIEQKIIELETDENLRVELNHQLGLLPKRQQEAIYLKFFENLSNEAIAEVMSISRQAVANLIYRTIRELREQM